MSDRYGSMRELLEQLPAENNYAVQSVSDRRSRIRLFAPHGGCIEPCTGPLVLELAGARHDYFIFQGQRKKDCYRELHVTSIHYDEPACLALAAGAELAIALHGCDGETPYIELGGGNAGERESLREMLISCGVTVHDPPAERAGSDPRNFVNHARRRGLQLELSAGFRKQLYTSFPRATTKHPEQFRRFVGPFQSWLAGREDMLGRADV